MYHNYKYIISKHFFGLARVFKGRFEKKNVSFTILYLSSGMQHQTKKNYTKS